MYSYSLPQACSEYLIGQYRVPNEQRRKIQRKILTYGYICNATVAVNVRSIVEFDCELYFNR